MDRPPGGWTDLVTNQTLELKLDALRAGLHEDMAHLGVGMAELSSSVDRRLRGQTWITISTMIAGLALAFTAGRIG